jgi:hypothetical protein
MCEVKSLDFIKKASDKVERIKHKADGQEAWEKGMERKRRRDEVLRNQENKKIAAFKKKKSLSLN